MEELKQIFKWNYLKFKLFKKELKPIDEKWEKIKKKIMESKLRSLDASLTKMTIEKAKFFSKWEGDEMFLCYCIITDKHAEILSYWKGNTLCLVGNEIKDEGAKYLLNNFKGSTLILIDNELTNKGIKTFANWKGHTLKLKNNKIINYKIYEYNTLINYNINLKSIINNYIIPDLGNTIFNYAKMTKKLDPYVKKVIESY